jgi:hypothetical protein
MLDLGGHVDAASVWLELKVLGEVGLVEGVNSGPAFDEEEEAEEEEEEDEDDDGELEVEIEVGLCRTRRRIMYWTFFADRVGLVDVRSSTESDITEAVVRSSPTPP